MNIKFFKELSNKDGSIAGGKGASLGEMTKIGIPVPSGFVVLSSAFDLFLKEAGLDKDIKQILSQVDYADIGSVDNASTKIRKLIGSQKIPEILKQEIFSAYKKLNCNFVAVRSSATAEDSSSASWAGELESYLNTKEKNLFENIKKCWSSLYTPRAMLYRREKKLLDTHISVAVVVQQMVESEISGIVFTVHPVTKNKAQMLIEAGLGLGEAIVSGSVTPDSFIVDKKRLSIVDVSISRQERMIVRNLNGGTKWKTIPLAEQEKQKLSGQRVIELAAICQKIESLYKKPQDIEWAFVRNKLYILQSRPITTL